MAMAREEGAPSKAEDQEVKPAKTSRMGRVWEQAAEQRRLDREDWTRKTQEHHLRLMKEKDKTAEMERAMIEEAKKGRRRENDFRREMERAMTEEAKKGRRRENDLRREMERAMTDEAKKGRRRENDLRREVEKLRGERRSILQRTVELEEEREKDKEVIYMNYMFRTELQQKIEQVEEDKQIVNRVKEKICSMREDEAKVKQAQILVDRESKDLDKRKLAFEREMEAFQMMRKRVDEDKEEVERGTQMVEREKQKIKEDQNEMIKERLEMERAAREKDNVIQKLSEEKERSEMEKQGCEQKLRTFVAEKGKELEDRVMERDAWWQLRLETEEDKLALAIASIIELEGNKKDAEECIAQLRVEMQRRLAEGEREKVLIQDRLTLTMASVTELEGNRKQAERHMAQLVKWEKVKGSFALAALEQARSTQQRRARQAEEEKKDQAEEWRKAEEDLKRKMDGMEEEQKETRRELALLQVQVLIAYV